MKKLLFLLSSVIAIHTSAEAQSTDPVSLSYFYRPNISVGNGELKVQKLTLNSGMPLYKSEKAVVVLTASYSYFNYDFDIDVDGWNAVHRTGVGMPVIFTLNDSWKWATVFRASLSRADEASFSDSLTYGAVSSLSYQVSENLSIGPGVSIFTQLEDSVSIAPILSLKWQVNDDWLVATGPSEGASSGANVYARYTGIDKWQFNVGSYYQNDRFRLSNSFESAPNGVAEDKAISVYFVAKHFFTSGISASAFIGSSVLNSYSLLDGKGKELWERSSDGSVFTGFRVSYEF